MNPSSDPNTPPIPLPIPFVNRAIAVASGKGGVGKTTVSVQDLSLLDAGRSLGLFRQIGVPILGVVKNMSYLICPHCDEPVEVFHRSERDWMVEDETVTLLGRIPMDIAISRGIHKGHPLVQAKPDADQAMAFREIAGKIEAALSSGHA